MTVTKILFMLNDFNCYDIKMVNSFFEGQK